MIVESDAGALIPVTVNGAKYTYELLPTPLIVCDAIGSGVTSVVTTGALAVVDVNVPATPPTVNVVLTLVAAAVALVCRTQTLCPGDNVVATEANTPLQPIEYVPPVTDRETEVLNPVGVAAAD